MRQENFTSLLSTNAFPGAMSLQGNDGPFAHRFSIALFDIVSTCGTNRKIKEQMKSLIPTIQLHLASLSFQEGGDGVRIHVHILLFHLHDT